MSLYRYRQISKLDIILHVHGRHNICAKNTEAENINIFTKLEASYGIKDRRVLFKYLGVEVKMDDSDSRITKTKTQIKCLRSFNSVIPKWIDTHSSHGEG